MTETNQDIELIFSFLKKLDIDPKETQKAPNIWRVKQAHSEIFIIVAGGFVIFQCKIMNVPKFNTATLYRKLLELNDNVQESLGSSFGVNKNNEIILKMLRPLSHLEFTEFSYYLTSIAHVAEKHKPFLNEKFDA